MKSHLIIVPCHSIWNPFIEQLNNYGQDSAHWYLAPFQFEGNDHLAFIKHGLKAIEILIEDLQNSLVILSGGQTKAAAGPISEAQSYYYLMSKLLHTYEDNNKRDALNFDDETVSILNKISTLMRDRNITLNNLFSPQNITTEEFSLDSFDNLVFSIDRFHSVIDNYPREISIVGFGFKSKRFIFHHARAIDFPPNKINYIAIEPQPSYDSTDKLKAYYEELNVLENKNALSLFANDWYAIKSPLIDKKRSRNPFKRSSVKTVPSLLRLDKFNGDEESHYNAYIKGRMPWSIK
ncbi:hypothetical protein KAFR_0A03780 [Kazachstania africana CBS 2517]|uniref:Uncharacterized protein n=1 Tax=Kazachstania africana (strain ATCC 22294 / BCRC 22015 / CBS 2517 / CECT 1963 / NBRC 1671 / NRRL Y-8276) TaxID=1071382 RepID=H2AN63_KAZAF|nr:hypothetical protein KAFR_0A03780 [Kazachstania africana CBS 2517]CCF55813.1 hypothetical protein KAFR_0A03780 [Kazachstania africana CBS 2517]